MDRASCSRRLGLAASAMTLAAGLAWAGPSFAQSATAPTKAAPTMNQAISPQVPGAIQQGSTAGQPAAPGEQKAQEKKDKAKTAKDKAKEAPKP